ncbi:hypothetical protein EYF80_060431 [Liparis tanakae]|uniref:Uncharacterized protein n=1 Tax=Liparis tanakae TaxID=230148 RepID=A0A4Z2EKS7_9TELE|nr:hypothetical protein EYF80_060431 [Liparis tanakae]
MWAWLRRCEPWLQFRHVTKGEQRGGDAHLSHASWSLNVTFPSRWSMLWAFFSSILSSFSGDRTSCEADFRAWKDVLFLREDAPLNAEGVKKRRG